MVQVTTILSFSNVSTLANTNKSTNQVYFDKKEAYNGAATKELVDKQKRVMKASHFDIGKPGSNMINVVTPIKLNLQNEDSNFKITE